MASRLKLPNFILIGAMKSGTTTMYKHLRRHPRVFMPDGKEPGFFSRTERYSRGIGAYADLFDAAKANQVRGEASTCYSRHLEYPLTAERIATHLPRVKLLYLVRHPAERAYSHYVHIMSKEWVGSRRLPIGLERALAQYPTILDASRYDVQCGEYLRHFQRSSMHLMTLDDLGRAPHVAVRDAFLFIGVDALVPLTGRRVRENVSGSPVARAAALTRVDVLRRAWLPRVARAVLPGVVCGMARRWAVAIVVRSGGGKRERREFSRRLDHLSPALRGFICRECKPATEFVEDWLGRRLDAWKA